MNGCPRVSIVTATFNRANVLRHTIESVRAQTFADWEMLIVGDACTDDTAEVVASFGDARIRFVNLPENSGEQALPNNEGVRLARGELVAFLNHDDLWFPEHLATGLESIGDAAFVSAVALYVTASGDIHLSGVCPTGVYDPSVPVAASSWLFRRSLAEEVGPWRPARELHSAPSQEWLFRAWRQGHRMRSTAQPTVLAIPSGHRQRAYADREVDIHAEYARLMREDSRLVERLLLAAALRLTGATQDISITSPLRRAARNVVRRAAIAFGVHPHGVQNAIRYRRKGGMLDVLRRNRGLTPLPRRTS
jgi:glycosyltransferase involved in cell wall biosynthesis